ncbi:MAG: metal-dependent hydrolase, partial [Corynebacterium sp.]|nr:metal-dependent hydrolase [Corynebacterium sp.]
MSSMQPTAPQPPEVKVIRSAKRKKTVQARMVSGVLEVRIPAWMSARDEREAVADMLARVEKKRGSGRRTDSQLEERARRLNAAYLDGRATIGSIRWVSNQNTRW